MKWCRSDFKDGEYIVYGIEGEIFYAEVMEQDSISRNAYEHVRIRTHFCLYEKFNENDGTPSPWSELHTSYILGKVDKGLSLKSLVDKYPEYIL